MNTIAHIVNPFRADKSSDLYTAQPITLQSMINAREKAKGIVSVDLMVAQFKEDTGMVPAEFKHTRHLDRSVLDRHSFEKKIKLPLIMDILERMYESSTAEYLIYTNIDIGLYPDFYVSVNDFINQGYDAFIINRRRLKSHFTEVSDLPVIYQQQGKSHPGFDCFVFHRRIFPKLKLEGICIGVPFIEISFSQNLMALSSKFRLFDRETLTFHIGEEIYRKRAPKDYFKYNQKQFWKIVPQLWPDLALRKFPYYQLVWPLRIIKWGLHPCIPIRLVLKLEWRNIKHKISRG